MLKRKEWPQCHRESSWQVRRSRLCQKEKEQSHLSKAPYRKGGESQGGREPHLGEKKAWIGKGGLHREGKGGQAMRASLEEVGGGMSG